MKNFLNGKICLTLVIIQKIFDNANKKVIGKMKYEYGGVIIDEFVGSKSKMYSIKKIDGSESSTAKGVNIATKFNEFKEVLFNKKIIKHKMKRIQAKKHKIGTSKIDKISLSCFDDKRFVLDNGVHTLAYFHKDCNKKCDKNENKNNNDNHDDDNDNHNHNNNEE